MPSARPVQITVLAILLGAGLHLLPAAAAPCCQSCEGWPDPPVILDWCWTHCILCGDGGQECETSAQCAPLQECINGYCSYWGLTGDEAAVCRSVASGFEEPAQAAAGARTEATRD